MEEAHKANKNFKCEVCGKVFFLEWRLLWKHGNFHMHKPKKCPFNRIGSKFDHDTLENSDIEDVEEENPIKQNQCHLCRLQLQSNDCLMDYMETYHVDYSQGILEYAATTRT